MTPNEAISTVIGATADAAGVSVDEILSPSRRQELVNARVVIAYRLIRDYGFGPVMIGRRLNRSHTAVWCYFRMYRRTPRYYDGLLRAVTERLMQIKGYGE